MKKENRENNEFTIVSALNQIELFSTQLASTTELEGVYTLTTSLTREILHLDYSTLLLLEDKEEQKLLLKATDGFSQEMVNTFVLHEGQGLPSLALENGQVETVVDFHLEDRFEVTSLMGELDIRSAIAAPMMIANRIFGVLIGHSLQ
ncbi:MAG: GAF domain-containing protein, partial [Desulfocapsaceae bacterium]|nr:GAF domain-containing protein [Desulfocapsaceae bacterium]